MFGWTEFTTKNMGWLASSAAFGTGAAIATYFGAPIAAAALGTAGVVCISGFVWNGLDGMMDQSAMLLETMRKESKKQDNFGEQSSYNKIVLAGRIGSCMTVLASSINIVTAAREEKSPEADLARDIANSIGAPLAFSVFTLMGNRLNRIKDRLSENQSAKLQEKNNPAQAPQDAQQNVAQDEKKVPSQQPARSSLSGSEMIANVDATSSPVVRRRSKDKTEAREEPAPIEMTRKF